MKKQLAGWIILFGTVAATLALDDIFGWWCMLLVPAIVLAVSFLGALITSEDD